MPLDVETVAKQLADSGIVSPGKLEHFVPPKAHPASVDELVAALVKSANLTRFQAAQVKAGKAKALVLGNYTILEKIGEGGMGQVFKAEHRRMERVVAIKVLPPAMTKDPVALARFQREVKAAARLEHPNIVTAYDADQAGSVHFFVMQYVDGRDLSDLVKKDGPLPIERALDYILQAARGLEAAHAEGIVHRDIKPANLLLDKKGTVKILDMGLARLSGDGDATTQAELTTTGAVMGTVDYMAPEQALGIKKADARADIYSLGCSFFYLLTGNAIYGGDSIMAKLLAHREQPIPSVRAVRSQAPELVDAVYQKMVSKTVTDRYQSATEVIADLTRCADRLSQFPGDTLSAIGSATSGVTEQSKIVAIKKTWALSTKLVAAICGTIIALTLATFLVKWLKTDVEQTGKAHTPGLDAQQQVAQAGQSDAASPPAPPSTLQQQSASTAGPPAAAPLRAVSPFDAQQAKRHQQEWADYLDLPVEYTNSIGMKFVLIPPGEFTMGSTPDEIEEALKQIDPNDTRWQECVKSESPAHKVVLTQPFYLAVREITQKEYEAVMGKNPSYFAKRGPDAKLAEQVAGVDTANHPVEGASWSDAAEFCAKLSKQEALEPFYSREGEAVAPQKATGYRLPTEAEWEFACRAGTTTRFWSGDKDDELIAAGWFGRNSGGRTHEVEKLLSNPWGLFDIHGNVWEWVEDGWEPKYYERFADTGAIDPRCPFSAGSQRALRGGSWNDFVSNYRSSARVDSDTSYRSNNVGFRVAKTIEPQTPEGNVAKASTSVSRDQPHTQTTTSDERAGKPADVPPPAIAPFDAQQAKALQEAWAKHLGVKVEQQNSVGMTLVLIPPGEFLMGSTPEEAAVSRKMVEDAKLTKDPWELKRLTEEEPQHKVAITKPYRFGRTEVTVGQFKKFAEAAKYVTEGEQFGFGGSEYGTKLDEKVTPEMKKATWRTPGYVQTDDLPVTEVTWNDAVQFCNWLSDQEKLTSCYRQDGKGGWLILASGTGYRLPTEAEWEYACRAGTTTQFSFGDDPAMLDSHGWFVLNSGGSARAVGLKLGNPFGLFDMHGNVYEWCQDFHAADYYSKASPNDPTGPSSGWPRVARGGFWYYYTLHSRSARRHSFAPVARLNSVGFRVLLAAKRVTPGTPERAAQ